MPYKTFFNWAFDGNIKTPIPSGENVPDILKYNSPIHANFLLQSFVKNGKLNHYLNKYINNIGIRYIDKKELFFFIKQCIIDYKFNRREIHYKNWTRNSMLHTRLSKKFPLLKKDELSIACEIVDNSNEKDAIYRSLGMDKKESKKTKKRKRTNRITVRHFIAQNFSIME